MASTFTRVASELAEVEQRVTDLGAEVKQSKEQLGLTAPFQYIVTTTTEPPRGDVRERGRVELSARSRFFRVDL